MNTRPSIGDLVPVGVARSLMGLFALFFLACSSSTEPAVTLWEATLSPVLPGGLTGQVAAVTQFGRTEASIEIHQAETGQTYGWRIQSGTCQSAGVLQGGAAVYPILTPDEAGNAGADVILSAVFRRRSTFAARVYQDLPGGGEEILACGDLVEH